MHLKSQQKYDLYLTNTEGSTKSMDGIHSREETFILSLRTWGEVEKESKWGIESRGKDSKQREPHGQCSQNILASSRKQC